MKKVVVLGRQHTSGNNFFSTSEVIFFRGETRRNLKEIENSSLSFTDIYEQFTATSGSFESTRAKNSGSEQTFVHSKTGPQVPQNLAPDFS